MRLEWMEQEASGNLDVLRASDVLMAFTWRFWTVGDFWKDNENLWRPASDKAPFPLGRDDAPTQSAVIICF